MTAFEQVREIVATTLKMPPAEITEDTSMETLAAWDSLAHINIMMGLEETFDLYLDVEAFPKLTSVSAILGYLNDQDQA